MLEPGARVGPYRVVRRLGAGASAEVFSARDDAIERDVALKVLRASGGDAARARLEREAKGANRVGHPGAVEVLAVGALDDGRPYLVQPLLVGRTLREELEAGGPLGAREAWRVARAAGEVLAAAHAAGVVHRDVKPENLFLELPSRRVRVLDFGLARVALPEGAASSLSAAGGAIGTPAYMPPEQWWSEGVDERSDQYALAATFFELATGAPPFGRGEVTKLLEAHLHAPPPALGSGPAGDAWLARALAKDKAARFASMDELLRAGDEALLAADGPAPSPAVGAPPPPVPERPGGTAGGSEGLRRPGSGGTAGARTAAAAAGLLGLAIFEALGYVGPDGRSLRHVLHIGGWGALAAFVLGVGAIARAIAGARGAWALLALAATSGAAGTYTGWQAVLAGVARARPEDRLSVFHEGAYEASASRFVGFAVAAAAALALAFGLAVGRGSRPRLVAPLRSVVAGAVALALFAALAFTVGAPAALASACVAGLSLLALAIEPWEPGRTDAPTSQARALACALAPVLAVIAGLSRVEARASAVFLAGLTRAERVDELARVARDRSSALAVGLVASLAVVLSALAALQRHERERARTRRAALVGLSALVVGVAADQLLAGRFLSHRAALQAALAAQLGVFSRVSPPTAREIEAGPPRRAAGVVISDHVIAVDGQPVAPPNALKTPEGVSNLARDVAHAIAAQAEGREPGAPDLSVTIDRETRWSVAAWALSACRRGGAVRVELLFTRGEQPKLSPLAGDAAHVVLPEDFVALPATLAEQGSTFSPEMPFSDVALMIQRKGDGTLVLAAP